MNKKLLRIKTPNYLYWRQPLYKISSFFDFLLIGDFKDGIYSIPSGEGSIDILIRGFDNYKIIKDRVTLNTASNCIVCFSGALTDQAVSMPPPYFFGIGISDNSNLPLISVSDPTLALDADLRLAWYAGNKCERSLQVLLSIIIDHICNVHEFQPIFVGGSGGGFAALVQSFLFKRESVTLVWNPQTAIEEYVLDSVLDFLEIAFPEYTEVSNFFHKNEIICKKSKVISRLSEIGILHNLCNLKFPNYSKIIYLQNKNDWHTVAHLNPFFREKNISRLGEASFSCGENIVIYFGDWGPGHEGPPTNIVIDLLGKVNEGHSIKLIVNSLNDGSYYKLSDAELKEYWVPEFEIKSTGETLSIQITGDDESCRLGLLEYALYWFSQGKKMLFGIKKILYLPFLVSLINWRPCKFL